MNASSNNLKTLGLLHTFRKLKCMVNYLNFYISNDAQISIYLCPKFLNTFTAGLLFYFDINPRQFSPNVLILCSFNTIEYVTELW